MPIHKKYGLTKFNLETIIQPKGLYTKNIEHVGQNILVLLMNALFFSLFSSQHLAIAKKSVWLTLHCAPKSCAGNGLIVTVSLKESSGDVW